MQLIVHFPRHNSNRLYIHFVELECYHKNILLCCALNFETYVQISGDIPDASPDRHSIRSPTPSYVDPSIPGMLSCYI
jgi:hypothetical protein